MIDIIATIFVIICFWIIIVSNILFKWNSKYGNPFKSKLVWAMLISVAFLFIVMVVQTIKSYE